MGVDIADNCLEEDVAFMRACLWRLPKITSKWAYCTDVMEHIPEEKVNDVLEQIFERTDGGAFFQIALTKDASGPLILGEPLHLTIQDTDWWFGQLCKFWDTVVTRRGTNLIAKCHGPV